MGTRSMTVTNPYWHSACSPYWPVGTSCWLTHPMGASLPEPDPNIDPDAPVPDDPGELLPDAPEPLPSAPIEPAPDDPGGDPAVCRSPPDRIDWRISEPVDPSFCAYPVGGFLAGRRTLGDGGEWGARALSGWWLEVRPGS